MSTNSTNFLIPKSKKSKVVNFRSKYLRVTPSDCKDIGIRKFEFVEKTQFVCKHNVYNIVVLAPNPKLGLESKDFNFFSQNVDVSFKAIKRRNILVILK